MAIELEEQFESRTGTASASGSTEKRVYYIKGESDPSEVLNQLRVDIGSAHPVYTNTILNSITVKPLDAVDLIEATYDYGDPTQGGGGGSSGRDENNEIWKFEMTSQSQTINYVESDTPTLTGSYQTMVSSLPSEQLLQPKANTLAIGVTSGEPVGVDVYRPYGAITVNKLYDIGEADQAFRTKLYKAQNTLNAAAWLNGEFGEKEVLFLGSSINYDYASQIASVDYSFLFGKKRDKIKILLRKPTASGVNGLTTEGTFYNVFPFEYIWLQYPEVPKAPKTTNPADGTIFCRYPARMYRSTLYLTSDFNELGLVGPS